jgi:hypothetical protein
VRGIGKRDHIEIEKREDLNALSIHRLLLTAILTTVKYHDDLYCLFARWPVVRAAVCGCALTVLSPC